VPAHRLAPQNLSSDKHVDVCADSDEDRGSTPLASSLRFEARKGRLSRRSFSVGGLSLRLSPYLKDYGLAGQPFSLIMALVRRFDEPFLLRLHPGQRE
jgi:hypothetical protein